MALKLMSSGGGSVTLDVPSTASNLTMTVPATTGTVVTTDSNGLIGLGTAPVAQSKLTVGGTGGSISVNGADSDWAQGGNRAFIDMAGSEARFGSAKGGGSNMTVGIYNGGVKAATVNANGSIQWGNQPSCRTSLDTGWKNFNEFGAQGTMVGLGNIYENRGGFYQGSNLAGYPVTHVPLTGNYLVTFQVYAQTGTGGRVYVVKNQSIEVVFIEIPGASTDGHFSAQSIISMTAGDYLNFKYWTGAFRGYHSTNHSQVTITYLG